MNEKYNVFTRCWYKRTPTGLTPHLGRKTYLAKGVSYAEAKRICSGYNSTYSPGKLSRKAEFTQV